MRQAQNDMPQAIALYLEGLGLLRDLEQEERDLTLDCLLGLAQSYRANQESFKAALVLGVHSRILEDIEPGPEVVDATAEDEKRVRQALGEAAWASAIAEGEEMMLDDLLVALARRRAG